MACAGRARSIACARWPWSINALPVSPPCLQEPGPPFRSLPGPRGVPGCCVGAEGGCEVGWERLLAGCPRASAGPGASPTLYLVPARGTSLLQRPRTAATCGELHSASPFRPQSNLVVVKNNSALKCAGTEPGAAASGGCGRASKPREETGTSPSANLCTSKIQRPLVLKPILGAQSRQRCRLVPDAPEIGPWSPGGTRWVLLQYRAELRASTGASRQRRPQKAKFQSRQKGQSGSHHPGKPWGCSNLSTAGSAH